MTEKQLPVYDADQVQAKINEHGLRDWYLEDGWLRRKYNTDGWPTTLMLVNAIGYLCEAAYHHADLAVTWGKVWVKRETSSHMPRPLPPPPRRSWSKCACAGS